MGGLKNDSKREGLVFVSNELDVYSLEEAVQLTREGQLERVHIVHRGEQIADEFYELAKKFLK